MSARRRRGHLACVGLALLGLSLFLLSGFESGESPLQAWERVEQVRQAEGPSAALALAQAAVKAHPDFLPLWEQLARVRTSLGGFTAARALRDSLRAFGTLPQARAAEVFLAREEGRFQAAMDTLALLSPPAPGSAEEALRGLDAITLSVSAGQGDRADSLIARIGSRDVFSADDSVARRYVELSVSQLQVALEFQRGRSDEALAHLSALATRAAAQNFRDLSMRLQHLRARSLFRLGRLEQCLPVYDANLDLAQELGDRWQIVTATAWKAFALEQLARYGAAMGLRKQSLEDFPAMGDTLGTSYATLSMGWDAMKIGDLRTSEKLLDQALRFGRQRGWRWMEAQACINLGVLYMDTGRFERSMDVLARARELAEATNNQYQRSSALNDIAILQMTRGRPDRAIEIYEQLLSLHRANADVDGQLAVLNNMALASENMGQDSQARVMYEEGLHLAAKHGLTNDVARINLGRNLSSSGQWEEGELALRAAIASARERHDMGELASAHAELGRCLSLQGKAEAARRHLVVADSIRVESGIVAQRVPDLLRLSMVEIKLGRGSEALKTLDRSQPLLRGFAQRAEPELGALRAEALAELGDLESARAQARRALAAAGRIGAEDGAEALGSAQIASGRALSVLLQSTEGSNDAQRNAITRETFQLLQQVQSRSLLEYVEGGQRSIEPDVPDSLLQGEAVARSTVDRIENELARAAYSPARMDSLRLALAEAQASHERLRTLIFQTDQRYKDVVQPAKLKASALTELLQPGTLVLDYLMGHGCEPSFPCPAWLFAADSTGVQAYALGDTPRLQRQIDLLLDLLARPPGPNDDDAIELMLSQLGHALLAPVADRLAGYRSVIIVPDGALAELPFAALRVPGGAGAKEESYVVEKAAIQTVPSLAVLYQLRLAQARRQVRRPRWDMAVWPGWRSAARGDTATSDPRLALPHAEEELHALTSRFRRSTVLRVKLEDEPALHAQLSALAPLQASKVLHFIAHGYFDAQQPWRSGLYLGPREAGHPPHKLEIADVYQMKLACDLVTLSACETARSQADEGVGFLGFTQALFGAGAPSVLATLWAIDDASTPAFMSTFYENLARGLTKAQALRQAQLKFLADDTLRQPFYWAPYVLVGDGSGQVDLALRRPGPFGSPRTTLPLAGLLLIGALWSWRRQRRF